MHEPESIRIIIADDHHLFREGIINLLNGSKDILVVGEAENGKELIKIYFQLKPDVIIVDISMPVLTGTEAVLKIKKRDPAAKVLFLTMHEGDEYYYYCAKCGGDGVINKNVLKDELVYAIRKVYGGKKYFGRVISDDAYNKLIDKYVLLIESDTVLQGNVLKHIEKAVLSLIGRGFTSNEIADKLKLSKRTIDYYRIQIMQKLDLKSLPDLIRYAVKFNMKENQKSFR
ncbi:MAG: response regulator [Ignavibacteria bacterium]